MISFDSNQLDWDCEGDWIDYISNIPSALST